MQRVTRVDVEQMGDRTLHQPGAKRPGEAGVAPSQTRFGDGRAHQHRMARLPSEMRADRIDAGNEPHLRRARKRHVGEKDQNLAFDRP